MGIKVKINIDWNKVKEKTVKAIDKRVLEAFYLACHDAVTWAKQNHEYTQQTGALNSSTGFQIYRDGTLVDSYFEQSRGGNDKDGAKAKGVAAGEKAAGQRASELGAHICAVIAAGMPYAVYVESKGYDVLTGTYHQFPAMLEKRMQEAFRNENTNWSVSNG